MKTMKKSLALILAIVMALGCMSITAFAAPPAILPLKVGGKLIAEQEGAPPKSEYVNEFGVLTGIDAITAGTVTYTAPEDNGGIDKLTLNNATITGNNSGIETVRYLEIELIGENTISYTGTNPYVSGISLSSMLFSGTGSLIIHNNAAEARYPTVHTEGSESITLPLGYTAVGSTSETETNIANMTKVSLDEVAYSQYTYYVGDVPAKTVVIYNPYSDSTDITLKVAKELSYEMVIPEDVTDLDSFGIFEVGQAKVANVKNATDKTVISYTAETTAFKSEGKTDIPASYYTDSEGTTAFPTTAVEVYKNKADAASIPTMYVGISENDWNAAENGTYTATVTFNFSAEEDAEPAVAVTIADILPDDFPTSRPNAWRSKTGMGEIWAATATSVFRVISCDNELSNLSFATDLTPTDGGNYTCTDSAGITWTFTMNGNKFNKITLSGAEMMADGEYYEGALDS